MAENDNFRKMLYHVLLEEYERLELLTGEEIEQIKAFKTQKKIELGLLSEEEIKEKFKTEKEQDEQNQHQTTNNLQICDLG